jgi:hypothetical protein
MQFRSASRVFVCVDMKARVDLSVRVISICGFRFGCGLDVASLGVGSLGLSTPAALFGTPDGQALTLPRSNDHKHPEI